MTTALERHRRELSDAMADRRARCAVELAGLHCALRTPRDTWQAGAHLHEIFTHSLWLTPPLRRGMLPTWLRQELPEIPLRTAYRYASLARHFSKDDVAKWGASRLTWLAHYDRGLFDRLRTSDPGQRLIHVPQRDGTWKVTTLADGCTLNELRKASRAARARSRASASTALEAEA